MVATSERLGSVMHKLQSRIVQHIPHAHHERKIHPEMPPGTELLHNHHLLITDNYKEDGISNIKLIVTGYPEGPNVLVEEKPKQYLTEVFTQGRGEDDKTVVAQVSLGSGLSVAGWSRHLNDTLRLFHNSTAPIDLVVYSCGAQTLASIPEEYWDKISSLSIISPFAGKEVLEVAIPGKLNTILKFLEGITGDEDIEVRAKGKLNDMLRLFADKLHIPSTSAYIEQIRPLIQNIQGRNKPISVHLGENDEILNSRKISDVFSTFGITADLTPRTHAIPTGFVMGLFGIGQ